ncbi:MAG TPA: DHA2 family efflux MFS transporter permease subunit, partial [Candidatus Methylacidiphilales bacterium]
ALDSGIPEPFVPHLSNLAQRAQEQGWLKWAIVVAASFASLLQVIDTSIVNVALPYMQGNLGATLTEIGWVSTAYSIANVIIIPLSAWLGLRFGKKRYFIFSIVSFVLASVMCGLSNSLATLIIGRVIQGFGGGGLLAPAQALIFQAVPREDQAKASTVFTICVIVGPAIGPALGGYLTDNFGWPWIFFINVPLGALALYLCWTFLIPDDPKIRQAHREDQVDWLGMFFLSLGLGTFQTFLEQGQEDDWFSSVFIQRMAILSVIGAVFFVWQELRVSHPAVNLRVLHHRSLAVGSIISVALGMGLYGTIFVIPVYVQNVLQFTATETGVMLIPGALASAPASFALAPMGKILSPRMLIASGCVMTIGVMIAFMGINPDMGYDQFYWPLLWRGFGSVVMFIPLSIATLGALPKKDMDSGSGFFGLTRQLGGSIGIAAITTLVAKQQFVHRAQIVSNVTDLNPAFGERLAGGTAYFSSMSGDPIAVHDRALALIDRSVDLQATLLSYRDVFYFVAFIFLLMLPLIFLLNNPPKSASSVPIAD